MRAREATQTEVERLHRALQRFEPVQSINYCKCGRPVAHKGASCIRCLNVGLGRAG